MVLTKVLVATFITLIVRVAENLEFEKARVPEGLKTTKSDA